MNYIVPNFLYKLLLYVCNQYLISITGSCSSRINY